MKTDDKMIDRIASLAYLRFNEDEKEQIRIDLEKILEFVGKLKELNTKGIEPLIYLSDSKDCLREDQVKDSLDRKVVLRNAQDYDNQFFLVPKVIDSKNIQEDE